MLFAPLALLLLSQTYVIDPSGAGDFTDLPQAVAAAAPGDTLWLQPGQYSPTTIQKELTLIGPKLPSGLGVTATVASVGGQGLVVDGVPGFTATNISLFDAELRNVTGRLRLDDVWGRNFEFTKCADVLLTRSSVSSSSSSSPALLLEDSNLQIQETWVVNFSSSHSSGDAIWTRGAVEVLFVGGRIEGGSTPGYLPSEVPGAAFAILDGTLDLVVRGSSNDFIDSGGDWQGFSGPVFKGTPSSLVWSGIAKTLSPAFESVPAEPYIEIGPDHNESPVRRLRAFGPAGQPIFVVMTAPSSIVQPSPYAGEPVRVDLTQIYGQKLLTLQGQNTHAAYSFGLPSGPSLVGARFDVQGLALMPAGELFVTNASQVILIE